MKNVTDLLQDADPLRVEPGGGEEARDRVRRAVLASAPRVTEPSSARRSPFRARAALLAAVAVGLVAIAVLGSRIWTGGSATLHAAAVRLEVRLAEAQPTIGLRAVRVGDSGRTIYLHPDVVVTNDDIAGSRVVPGDGPSHFGVAVTFTLAGTEKMRRATASHVGAPVAILLDGEVISAPTVRSAITDSAVISGDFTRAEAERIADGMTIR
jgi:hypothetical protein